MKINKRLFISEKNKPNNKKQTKRFITMCFLPSVLRICKAGLWRFQERALTRIKLSSREWVSKGFVSRLYLGNSFQGPCFSSWVFMWLNSQEVLCVTNKEVFYSLKQYFKRYIYSSRNLGYLLCSPPQTSSSKPVGHDSFGNTLSPKILALQLKQYKIIVMK